MESGKSSINNDKSLCLYCDKAFSNLIDQKNHVERDHHTNLKISKGKGSRKSERITKISGLDSFQGCFYCSNRKLTSGCDDLEALFKHLLTAHKDVCYVCKCRVRLQSKAALESHKKNCKIGGVNEQVLFQEKTKTKRGTTKKTQVQCDNISDSEELSSHQTRTNAMIKKSENCHTSYSILNKRNYVTKNSSSSSTISSCSSKTNEEYAIPLTRQKFKDSSVNSTMPKNRATTSNKKTLKASAGFNSCSLNEENNDEFPSSTTQPTGASKVPRTKPSKGENNNIGSSESVENSPTFISILTKNEAQNTDFDVDFYNKISYNIKANLNNFIDGKADSLWNNKFQTENFSDSNRLETNHQNLDIEIHQATNFELLAPPFPALLTPEQYGFGDSNPNKNKRKFTKNSWKWRWDLIKKYKYVNEGGKVVKKVKQITTGLKDLSQLDMWTQLSMRSRYEDLNCKNDFNHSFNNKISKRTIKSQNIEQLNCILDKRLTPEINIEQLQQMMVKEEFVENEELNEDIELETSSCKEQMLKTLHLAKTCCNKSQNSASLSGEWARPRCFICIDCGLEFDLMKSLNDHKNSEHPYVVSAHYEVVGRENLKHKLYKNLFIPKKALNTIGCSKSMSLHSDSKCNEISSSSKESGTMFDQKEKECTKCKKFIKYSNDIDIYRHILDCIEDKVWMQAKRRNKYRRSRRKPKKCNKKNQNRPLIEEKKDTSSPLSKDYAEGESLPISISNPPATKEDENKSQIGAVSCSLPPAKLIKSSSGVSESFISNDERGNIKSFFRVSKTTPNLPQKMVVQMLQMPNTHTIVHNNNSVRHSLRSSVKRQSESNIKNSSENLMNLKSNESCDFEKISKNEETKCEKTSNKTVLLDEQYFCNQVTSSKILTSLHINTPEKNKSILTPKNSPTNSTTSSIVSPTSFSSVPKKKKKLNDCIAMLTCKIQEKLGVNFFANASSEICPLETIVPQLQEKPFEIALNTAIPLLSTTIPSIVSSGDSAVTSCEKSPTKQVATTCSEQNQVIDLSFKKACSIEKEKPLENNVQFDRIENSKDKVIAKGITDLSNTSTNEPFVNENELSLNSFTISIAKEKIPDLDAILEKQNSINVSKLKISESERRAFEEQKNRIMQILGKKTTLSKCKGTHTLTKKKTIQTENRERSSKKNCIKKLTYSHEKAIPNAKKTVVTILEKHDSEVLSKQKSQNDKSLNADSPGIKIFEHELKISKENENNSKVLAESTPRVESRKKRSLCETKKGIEVDLRLTENNNYEMKSKTCNYHLVKEVETVEAPQISLKTVNSSSIPFTAQNDSLIQGKIQQAIKATNRIRCRRLSVVVDPIIHLSGFQKNRKIRLTNNSQQNGFYDLLTNEQIFNAIKNTPQLKKEIEKFETKKGSTTETIRENKAAILKTNIKKITKAKRRSLKNAAGKVMKVTKKKKKTTIKNCENKSESDNTNDKNCEKLINLQETIKSTLNKKNVNLQNNNSLQTTKSRTKKGPINVNHKKPKFFTSEAEKSKIPTVKNSKRKGNKNFINCPSSRMQDKTKPSLSQKKDINSEIAQSSNIHTERTKKMVNALTEKHAKKKLPFKSKKNKKLILLECNLKSSKQECLTANNLNTFDEKQDASLSSDTSTENDIPLAQLISNTAFLAKHKSKESIINQAETKNIRSNFETAIEETLKKMKNNSSSKNNIPVEINSNVVSMDEQEQKLHIRKNILSFESATTTKKSEAMLMNNHSKEPLEKNVLTSCEEKKPKDFSSKIINNDVNFEVFSLNEDSFFNDDNDVDQANDRINALVKNIINSSELIDSESEKIDHLKQKSTCFVCNKTFKNEKVLVKHNKTSTHLLKEKRREKQSADNNEVTKKINPAQLVLNEETKVFRTKGALKTFDNILSVPSVTLNTDHKQSLDKFTRVVEDSNKFILSKENDNLEDDDEELSTKDKIFDSLFSNIENKLQAAAKNELLPKFDFPSLSHHDSESSTASWDLKHDADVDWDAGKNVENNYEAPMEMISNHSGKALAASSGGFVKEKLSKIKEAIVPTKSLIMGKIFKKHRDKQKTPQADAPYNKLEIKNSLDEIFDHLKNSAEIDDKVLTCPSPKSLLKSSKGTFSRNSSHSNDMLETASHSNNHKSLIQSPKIFNEKEIKNNNASKKNEEEEENGIGKRKSRRRCAVKMKTFAETWSSDEYEELHDTNDIISIINEIEKRESTLKQKEMSSLEIACNNDDFKSKKNLHSNCLTNSKLQGFKKRRMSSFKDGGHKSDDDLNKLPLSSNLSLKKRRMSCYFPSTSKLNLEKIVKKTVLNSKVSANASSKDHENKLQSNANIVPQKQSLSAPKINVNSLGKCVVNTFSNVNLPSLTSQTIKKKNQKHRKRPRNKIKNIAYDSDSDFELNLNKKAKAAASSTVYSEIENDSEIEDANSLNDISSDSNKLTAIMKNQPKLLPNDLKVVALQAISTPKAAKAYDQLKPSHQKNKEALTVLNKMQVNACNRTKRHSSEKLYYWSSSSDSDDIEQGDMPEGGENEDSSMIPQQPEQHGWIVGDSHKKLVTLLAHAKINNKIN